MWLFIWTRGSHDIRGLVTKQWCSSSCTVGRLHREASKSPADAEGLRLVPNLPLAAAAEAFPSSLLPGQQKQLLVPEPITRRAAGCGTQAQEGIALGFILEAECRPPPLGFQPFTLRLRRLQQCLQLLHQDQQTLPGHLHPVPRWSKQGSNASFRILAE